MNRIQSVIATLPMLVGMNALAAESALRQQLNGPDGWIAYRVPMVSGAGSPCCYSGRMSGLSAKTGCNLDARNGTFTSNEHASAESSELGIYWHVTDGRPDQVRAFAADCAVTSRQEIRWIDQVNATDSVAVTAELIGQGSKGRDSMELSALALQADASATDALIALAASTRPAGMREDAIFWLGRARGAPGADYVENVALSDSATEVREHAVFALSQSQVKDAYERVQAISRKDAADDVRSKALFWMAQMHDPRAAADITAALSVETSEEVREEGVFALSQLDETMATSALISVIRGNYPRPIKEKALFWLGQAGTDEAMAFLDEMLSR